VSKVLALLSEGLDGVLAARLLEAQGVEVVPVHFRTGFARGALPPDGAAFREAAGLEAPCEAVDVGEEYLRSVVLAPKHGYGSALNPCIDCRIFLLRKADEIRTSRGLDAIATGEVLGQDRMSQKRAALETIAREAGVESVLVRPLSARHLPESEVERRGAIDRERLGSIHGRARDGQRSLAALFGIKDAPEPTVGCCLLADAAFARRMRDLLSHRAHASITIRDVELLRIGRHFRLAHDLKVVLGRDREESDRLAARAGDLWTCRVASGHGSFGLVEGELPDDAARDAVAGLAARYSRERERPRVEVDLRRAERAVRRTVRPAADADVERFLLR
jgi:hypothetical protein